MKERPIFLGILPEHGGMNSIFEAQNLSGVRSQIEERLSFLAKSYPAFDFRSKVTLYKATKL